ncbi:hypothetical protein [Lactococcus lactis]|jgi:hypothetical protein|uniref:hypothetical protein n=1 Tax=Lactococcus lactis TaxID=1358 RepID=UPI0021A28902|nr:hypothetical protein [Lactococcus lactis]MCT3138347.1 hypothetical protein [Lactococcus lactis]
MDIEKTNLYVIGITKEIGIGVEAILKKLIQTLKNDNEFTVIDDNNNFTIFRYKNDVIYIAISETDKDEAAIKHSTILLTPWHEVDEDKNRPTVVTHLYKKINQSIEDRDIKIIEQFKSMLIERATLALSE